ncbi:MAG TPA: calcium-binding protein [Allosphingosinicella sp.]
MKIITFAGAALIALSATAATARPMGRGAQPLTRATVEQRVDAGFARVDANRDGFVTREEAQAVSQARRGQRGAMRGDRREARQDRRAERFAQLDSNRDGMISRAEFDARQAFRGDRAERRAERMERRGNRASLRGQRGGGQGGLFARFGGRMFDQADANRDGRVSREEARRGALALFARIDTNRDGAISIEERRAVREGMRAQRGQRRQG